MTRCGSYINLDRSTDRRDAMQAQLDALGMPWVQRMPAVDGRGALLPPECRITATEFGCFVSHLRAIEAAPADAFGFVFEDDAELSPDLPLLVGDTQLGALAGHDLVFLGCQPDCSSHIVAQLWRSLERRLSDPAAMLSGAVPRRVDGVDLVDAAAIFRWGLQAYVVTPSGRPRIAMLLREALAQGPSQPVDLLIGDALRSGRLRGIAVAPFLATPRLASYADTTIGPVPGQDTQALAAAVRRLLFAGPVDGIDAHVTALLARPRATSPQLALLGTVISELVAVEAREGSLTVGERR